MSALTHSVSRETKFAFVSIDFTTEYCPTGGLELVKVTAPDNLKIVSVFSFLKILTSKNVMF